MIEGRTESVWRCDRVFVGQSKQGHVAGHQPIGVPCASACAIATSAWTLRRGSEIVLRLGEEPYEMREFAESAGHLDFDRSKLRPVSR